MPFYPYLCNGCARQWQNPFTIHGNHCILCNPEDCAHCINRRGKMTRATVLKHLRGKETPSWDSTWG